MRNRTTAILLAGGQGQRMGAPIPKQYLALGDKPMARHSFDLFLSSARIDRVVVVCEERYRSVFKHCLPTPVIFAKPGLTRQGSAYQGFLAAGASDYLCIHDAAYPLLSLTTLHAVLDAAHRYGAALAATPVRYTIKEADGFDKVHRTPERHLLWNAQTPQVIRRDLLEQGYALAKKEGVELTDDVALVERLGHPVKLVDTPPENIKVTTAVDFQLAELLYRDRLGNTFRYIEE